MSDDTTVAFSPMVGSEMSVQQSTSVEGMVDQKALQNAIINANKQLAETNADMTTVTISGTMSGKLTAKAADVNDSAVFIGGKRYGTDKGAYINEYIILETDFEHKQLMNSLSREPTHTRYTGDGMWRAAASGLPTLVEEIIADGFSIQMHPAVAEELFMSPPDQTQSWVDAAVEESDHPESHAHEESNDTTHEQRSGGESNGDDNRGGAITPDVAAGECPGCGKDLGTFRKLRGHIGGKVRGGCEDHMNLGLTIEQYR